jgi:RNA polymerase sigma-70 factor (ECF subfamily)
MEGIVGVDYSTVAWKAGIAEMDDFDEVVRLYRPRIFRYLIATLRDRDLAESLTQDCFLKAWNARHQFRGDSSLMTWLTRIAVNLARDHARSQRMRFWQKARAEDIDPADIGDWLADERSSPEQSLLAREQAGTVWEAVKALSPNQRTVFLLRFVEEMELPQIAVATGMNENTVKSHLYRALRAVREKVGTRV